MASSKSSLAPLLRLFNVSAFLKWWGTGLAACLPPSLRRLFSPALDQLLVIIQDDELILIDKNNNNSGELGRYPLPALAESGIREQLSKLKDKAVVLCLDPRKVLSKVITLPLAAEANLRQVIGFEIDRLTPFPADKIYYDACIVERQETLRQVRVNFAMVMRQALDSLTAQLAAVDIAPDVVTVTATEAEAELSPTPMLNLLPMTNRPRKGVMAQRIRWVLLALVLVSAMAAAALPLWQQRNSVVTLLPQAQQAQLQAEEIFQLRKAVDDSIESASFLLQKRKEHPLTIDLLNELTVLLPDNTWVEQLNVRGDELQVRGQSLEASQLISLVEDSDYFYNVTFRSPVSRDRRTGRDRFYLSAQIVREFKPGGPSISYESEPTESTESTESIESTAPDETAEPVDAAKPGAGLSEKPSALNRLPIIDVAS